MLRGAPLHAKDSYETSSLNGIPPTPKSRSKGAWQTQKLASVILGASSRLSGPKPTSSNEALLQHATTTCYLTNPEMTCIRVVSQAKFGQLGQGALCGAPLLALTLIHPSETSTELAQAGVFLAHFFFGQQQGALIPRKISRFKDLWEADPACEKDYCRH